MVKEEKNLEKKKSVAKTTAKVDGGVKKTAVAKGKVVAKASPSKKVTPTKKIEKVAEGAEVKQTFEKTETVKQEEVVSVKKAPVKKVVASKKKRAEDVGTVVVAKVNNLKGGVKKIVLLANSISGLKCDVAVSELEFSKKRVAKDVKNVLQSAIANARNNYNLDLDRLYVKEAIVGKSYTLKRWRARAKGRGVRILKKFSRMEIKLVER